MPFTETTRNTVGAVRHAVTDGLDRGVRLARIGTLQWQLHRQHAALGRAIYPLLIADEVHTSLPEALEYMTRIESLTRRLSELRPVAMQGAADQLSKDEDEARWADEGGQHVG